MFPVSTGLHSCHFEGVKLAPYAHNKHNADKGQLHYGVGHPVGNGHTCKIAHSARHKHGKEVAH